MNWGIAEWKDLFVIVTVILGCLNTVAMLYLRNIFATRKDFGAIGDRISRHGERLNLGDGRFVRIEERMRALPTTHQLGNLSIQLERLSGDMRAMTKQIEGYDQLHQSLKRQVDVMDDYLRQMKA